MKNVLISTVGTSLKGNLLRANHAYPVSAESLDPAGRSGEYAAGIKRVAQSEQGVATNLATLLAFETL